MHPSIKDIARAAGLSHSTVSRALSGSPLVNAETCRRIAQIAAEMDYIPDARARSLVLKYTQTIGVVVTFISDPFMAELIQELETEAHAAGYTIILASSHAEPDLELETVRILRSKRVDGVIVTSSTAGSVRAERVSKMGVPVVLINSHSERGSRYAHSVTVDNVHGGYVATRHLAELGHQRIAYVGGPDGHSSSAGRATGYRKALKEAGLHFDPSLVRSGEERIDSGERIMPLLLDRDDPPSAVFCYNDATAVGVLRACASRKLRVPRDISVVGFDDIELARAAVPSLTTVAQPKSAIARTAVAMLFSLMRGADPQRHGNGGAVIKGELVVRESTAIAPKSPLRGRR